MGEFKLYSPFEPRGDQPQAIRKLVEGYRRGRGEQALLGVTGSGKTFTMAHVIEALDKPTLVISHNKTLAAQLYGEFREFFPENAVGYFVSYYDYYQPEAYIPQRDIYIEKDASINEQIDRLRLRATSALMGRRDVVIVASVSCIYGLGSPEDYEAMLVVLEAGATVDRKQVLGKLVTMQYRRNDLALERGTFRVLGDVVEVYPAYEEFAYRLELFGEELESIAVIDPVSAEVLRREESVILYPAKHFVMPEDRITRAQGTIAEELEGRLAELRDEGKLLEAQRLEARMRYDMELMQEIGYCPGIENYSRHLAGRGPGERPYTLIDYFRDDFLLIIDESHVTIPQIRGMYEGDHSRKMTLVEHGFRLPSALDNRPLRFEEFLGLMKQMLYVSATPAQWELGRCGGEVVEQVIRPTGLVDPVIRVEKARTQVTHLIGEVRKRVAMGDRVLVTTLTKRLAEELAEYLAKEGCRTSYLHSEIDTIERVEVLRELREGKFDVLVGVNLLREGLDLPEVSMVAILDADKEGFLRSQTSLIQTIGRAARNVNAEVVLYADEMTEAMRRAIEETGRRREMQLAYNEEHGIRPETIRKAIRKGIEEEIAHKDLAREAVRQDEDSYLTQEHLAQLEREMYEAAEALEFEEAGRIRDEILEIRRRMGKRGVEKPRRGSVRGRARLPGR
ncbi:MAG: excinuclease ABC subunit UvrB [Planctomycetota bacterium]